jgi:hypothetical protein
MRSWLSAAVILIAVLVGYALAPGALRAQPTVPFSAGQRLVLTFAGGRQQGLSTQVTCIVTMRDGDFIGCRRERTPGSDEREIWYNLRYIDQIELRER